VYCRDVDEADIGQVYRTRQRAFCGIVSRTTSLPAMYEEFAAERERQLNHVLRCGFRSPIQPLKWKANIIANAEIFLEEKKNVLMGARTASLFDRTGTARWKFPTRVGTGKETSSRVRCGISTGV